MKKTYKIPFTVETETLSLGCLLSPSTEGKVNEGTAQGTGVDPFGGGGAPLRR